MKFEVLPSSSSFTDDDQKNLKELLGAFGSSVSLEDIASAYCQADREICATAEILCNKQDSSADTKSQDGLESKAAVLSGCQSDTQPGEAHIAKAKQKRCSATMGTVAGLIGREYVIPRIQSNGSHESSKPMKLNSDEIPETEIWDERKDFGSTSRNEYMKSDMGELLFKMLGNGFQLEMSVIQDVVGQCGYDMQMSVDKLLDISAATLGKSDDVIGITSGNTAENSLSLESRSLGGSSEHNDFSGRSNSDVHSRDQGKNKKDIEREILSSIFSVPGRIEEMQESTFPVRHVRRAPYGQAVVKPLKETIIEDFTFLTREPVNSRNDEEDQNSYENLRKAVTEYWLAMKQYFKAAVDALKEGEYENFQKFTEDGNFYMKKAREADEKSSQKLIDDSDEGEEISINAHCLEPKDALGHVKRLLTTFCGLPSVHKLKVVAGTNNGDTKDVRRKRLITKLLEKEGISWTEEGNDGWIISIRVDEIDPNKLSFAKK